MDNRYQKMGVLDLVAQNASHFADLAVRVCTDEPWRRHIVDRISSTRDVLFSESSHKETVNEWDTFLSRAVLQTRRGSPELHPSSNAESVTARGLGLARSALLRLSEAPSSVLDFGSPPDMMCSLMKSVQAATGGVDVRRTRLVMSTREVHNQSACDVSGRTRLYDPVVSGHPAVAETFDVALSLDHRSMTDVLATSGVVGVFTCVQSQVLLMLCYGVKVEGG